MKTRSPWLLVAALCCFAAPAAGNGTIDIQTQSFDNFIAIDVIVQDDGLGTGCTSFTLQRRSVLDCDGTEVTLATIPRQSGTHQVFDGPLPPNTAYKYRIVPCAGFHWAYDCGYGLGITAYAMTTGPGLTPIGHGTLESPGTPYSFVYCGGYDCSGANVVSVSPQALPYVNSGIPVIVYGTFERNCQWEWFYLITQAVPASCTVGVEGGSWSTVKVLFR
jgi:hypothetical protein